MIKIAGYVTVLKGIPHMGSYNAKKGRDLTVPAGHIYSKYLYLL
jgi:hypothetical protein